MSRRRASASLLARTATEHAVDPEIGGVDVPLSGQGNSVASSSSRFQSVLPEFRRIDEDHSSFTATSGNIRGDTAELADFGVFADEGAADGAGTPRASGAGCAPEADAFSGSSTASRGADEGAPLLAAPLHSTPTYASTDDGARKAMRSDNLAPGTEAMKEVHSQWSILRRRMNALAHSAKATRGWGEWKAQWRGTTWSDLGALGMQPLRELPAVILGVLLNILDGVSYGMIMFPTSLPIFANFGGDGVSMFFVTCLVAQLVYTLGGSIFRGGNGSMMIEVVPFYHILVQVITASVGESDAATVVATTMAAFALSTLLTGLAFLLLGSLRLGVLISYFPRHILVGCIGGVGVFLVETGLAVAGHIESEGGLQYNFGTLHQLTLSAAVIAQWTVPLGLAFLLNAVTARIHHPLVFPMCFLAIPLVFYAVAFGALGCDLPSLREQGWVFNISTPAQTPFWHYYTYFDFRKTSWRALWETMPTQMALVFFGILHVPLNVPALGVSVSEDNVDTDRELVAHGISNLAAGMLGTVPNYLCYVNSVLFYRVGGGSRLSGLMLAAGTCVVLLAGPGMIAFLPIMVVAALIFVLGIDLVREALYETIGRVNRLEYLTIVVIVAVMTLSDFVVGCLAGIVLASVFFVMQTSRRNVVRSVFNGHAARSTVRRQATQSRFLDDVGRQTLILKLQGSLFFGTINPVEQLIRQLLDIAMWKHNPLRFLVMDLSLATSVDFSAAEALTRIHRMLSSKGVHLVFCGVKLNGDIAAALRSVDLWTDRSSRLEVFASLNEALEWTENEYLRGMYTSGLAAGRQLRQASMCTSTGLRVPAETRKPAIHMDHDIVHSPRAEHLHQAAKFAVQHIQTPPSGSVACPPPAVDTEPPASDTPRCPMALLAATLGPYAEGTSTDALFHTLIPELQELLLVKDTTLWCLGDEPDALYFIDSGILKARYVFPQDNYEINEAMLAGTVAGELSFLSQQKRDTEVTVELDAKVWRLDSESLQRFGQRHPPLYAQLIETLLRVTADEQHRLLSYLVSRLS
ncbi:hypothetical protein MSPP1_001577 [Malassezia sp. CBS 17886]|nr:hypothetical protein MSPP1_001577 [Malassezia sp. CBS 17886]